VLLARLTRYPMVWHGFHLAIGLDGVLEVRNL